MHESYSRVVVQKLNWNYGLQVVDIHKHPADELGLALSRASGILSSIENCYDNAEEVFATSTAFVAEAVRAVEQIISQANANLADLYSNYSLQPLDEQDLVVSLPIHEPIQTPNPFVEKLFVSDDSAKLSNKLDSILSTLPQQNSSPHNQFDQPARTYDELLYKLTAMTNVASQNANEESLLPMLENLRADMLRIRSTG
jgi:hypothetical protein